LGEDVGEFYVVKNGLEEGEEIAINGVFRIDASAQLSSKKSMMNPEGGAGSTGGMAGMDMGGDDDKKDMDMSKMDMKKEVVIDKSKIPMDFKQQLGTVVSSYLLLKDKLTKDNASIKTEVEAIQKALKKVDMTLLLGDAHNVWMKSLNAMNKDLKKLSKAVNIGEQRTIFLTISKSLF